MSIFDPPTGGRSVPYMGRVRGGPPGSQRWITYPDPYFDIAGTYLPEDIKSLFKWVRYYAVSDPLISAGLASMSEYPITKLLVDSESSGEKTIWERYLEDDLNLRTALIDIGLHFFTYGNVFLSLFFPFTKMLTCGECGYETPAKNASYKYRHHKFEMTCKRCGEMTKTESYDHPHKSTKGARIIIWDPERLDVDYNEITGKYRYTYNPSLQLINKVKMGNRETVESLPQNFLDAIRRGVAINISQDNICHLRRPTLLTSDKSKGLGAPLLMPVMKNIFHIALMRKAQEQILAEKVLPFNVIYPQQSASNVNPYEMVNLRTWRENVIEEINKWRRDPLYMAVMPLPLGHQTIGGEARALLMSNEIRAEYEIVLAGCGIPSDFLFGGLQYSGSNVSLRMMENKFLVYRAGLQQMIQRFIIPMTSARMGWPKVNVHFDEFKMADDLQRKAFLFELVNAGKASDTTLQRHAGLNPEEEDALMKSETSRRLDALKRQQLAEAEIMGEVQVLQSKYQVQAERVVAEEQQQMQQGMHESAPGEPGQGTTHQPMQPVQSPSQGIGQIIQQLQALSPEAQQMRIQAIEQQNPQLGAFLRQQLGGQQGGGGQTSASLPLPNQLPPRRGAENAMI